MNFDTDVRVQRIVAAVLVSGDRVLLVRRGPGRTWYPNLWDLPGGHVEDEETEVEGLARELKEELAVTVSSTTSKALTRLYDRDVSKGYVVDLSVWLVIEWTGGVKNNSPREHSEIRWVNKCEIADLDLAHPEYSKLLGSILANKR